MFFVSLWLVGNGQVLDMSFTTPFNDKTFESKSIRSISQDQRGFLWIGTNEGLYCFNGKQLSAYYFNYSDSTSLVENNIKKIFVDKSGILWVGTNVGLCIYNQTLDNFIRIADENNYAGLENLQVSSIKQNQTGDMFVAVGSTINKYNRETGLFSEYFKVENGNINEFIFDENDNLWIAVSENGGLIFARKGGNNVEQFLFDPKNTNSISSNNVIDIALIDDRLWIGTYGAGVNALNIETRKVKRYIHDDPYSVYTRDVYVDNKQNIWTCDLTGLKLYDKQNDQFFGYYGNIENEYTLKSSVVCMYEDRQGNYWIGYNPGGVSLRSVPKGFEKYDKIESKLWHTSDNNITAIEFDASGDWWLGNGFNGINIFDRQNGTIKTYNYSSSDNYSLGQGGVACIYRDKKNTMWVGTNFGGLQHYNQSEDRFYSYRNNPDNGNSIANNDVRSIVEDSNRDLWIVTHGKGIDRFNKNSEVFYHYTNKQNNLSNDWVFQVLVDSNENLWAATAWGVGKLAKGESQFVNYIHSPNDTNSICDNQVNCLFEDSNNRIWLGTINGLCEYRKSTNDFVRYSVDMQGENISGIQEDKNGYLWVSTNEGITRLNPKTREVLNFDESDGLLKGAYNKNAVAKSENKTIFFGGLDGVSVFDPEQLVFNKEQPKVYITGLNLFYKPVNRYGEKSILKKHISETREITLKYDQNLISLEFVASNLINPEKNKYKYKMEGVDRDWVDSGSENVAVYSQLQPGKYTFRIIASNNDNVWNTDGASLKIVIQPPWWQTWWFKLVVSLSVILLLVLFVRQRMAKLIKQKNHLEEMVLERTNVLNEKNIILEKRQLTIENQSEELRLQSEELRVTAENIEEKNEELTEINATKDKLFSIVAHDLLNPFNVILGFTGSLIENFETWNNQQKLEALNYIKESSDNAFSLLENLLHWSRTQKGKIEFNPEPIVANVLIRDVLEEVSSFALKKEVEIVNLFQDDVLKFYADKNMLKLICRNLLTNAIKFSNPSGKVSVDLLPDYNQSFIRFSVSDQGVGMEKEKAENLFNFEKNSSTRGTNGEKGVGLGLILCFDFVQAHKGEIWVESQPNKGTKIFFTVPKSVAVK